MSTDLGEDHLSLIMKIGITTLQGLISAIWDRLATATRRTVFGTEVTDGFELNSRRSSVKH